MPELVYSNTNQDKSTWLDNRRHVIDMIYHLYLQLYITCLMCEPNFGKFNEDIFFSYGTTSMIDQTKSG